MQPFFESLSHELREQLYALGTEKAFEPGDEIFREGYSVLFFSVIVSGKVKVVKFQSDGKEAILSIFKKGDAFMVPPLIDGLKSPSTAIAIERTTVLQVPREAFLRLLQKHNELALAVIDYLVGLMREKTDTIHVLASPSPEQRIAQTLVKILQKENALLTLPFQVPLRRQDIASMAGLTTETTIRVIRNMAKKKILRIEHGKIFIDDLQKLLA
ncbi:MAG: Crp/Fnr family transcriptional regulator [Candidatus Thermochlorobacter sp.]